MLLPLPVVTVIPKRQLPATAVPAARACPTGAEYESTKTRSRKQCHRRLNRCVNIYISYISGFYDGGLFRRRRSHSLNPRRPISAARIRNTARPSAKHPLGAGPDESEGSAAAGAVDSLEVIPVGRGTTVCACAPAVAVTGGVVWRAGPD